MDLLLISLILFSTFSQVYPSATKTHKLLHSTSKANSLNNSSKSCICWQDALPPTLQQLDPQNNGLERIVIYLYKNDATNEIKMYTPNINKQMLIPEIPYEAGDELITVTTADIYTLLNNNPNKIKVYNDHIEKLVPSVTESLAIGLSTGAIEDFYPNGDDYLNQNNNYKGNEYSLPENIIIANEPSTDFVNEPQKGPKNLTNIPYNVFPEPYNPNTNKSTPEQNWMPNNYSYTNPDDPQAVPFNPQTAADNAPAIPGDFLAIPFNPQSPPYTPQVTPMNSQSLLPNAPVFSHTTQGHYINPQAIPANPQADTDSFPELFNPNTNKLTPEQNWMPNNYPYTNPDEFQTILFNPQTTADNAPAIPGDSLAITFDPQSSPYTLQVTPIDSQSLLPNAPVFPYNYQDHYIHPQIPGNPHVVPGSHVGELDHNHVYTFQTDQGSNKLQLSSQDINNPLSDQYMTFNIWFHQQMKRFQNVHLPNDIKTIDSNALKILVQKTFYENNMYISADGVITDAEGIAIDASNLELRPLLLGETFNHQILQNTKVIKLPKYLPYLEGILVTLVSPPLILGIIPLGKTYLTETSYQIPSASGLISVNGNKIHINGIGNSNATSHSTSGKGTYTLAYKDIHTGPTKYYAHSGANGIPVAGNSKIWSYSNVVHSIGNKKPKAEYKYWSSGPYQTVGKLPYPTVNWNPPERVELNEDGRKMSDVVIQHHYEQPLRTKKKGKGRNKPTYFEENVTTVEPFPTTNATDSDRTFPSISSVVKTLMSLLDNLPSRRGGADVVHETESLNDGGGPDFRIIGGNAATGSGTPLSNKGRSGVEYA